MASVDHRSAAEIERELEEERGALARTLDEIQDRLSFEALSNDLVDRVRDGGGEFGRTVVSSVREHPVPIALTAIGLAWLIASQRTSSEPEDPYRRAAATPASGRWRRSTAPDLRDPGAVSEPAPLYDASGRPVRHEDHHSRWDRARDTASEYGARAAGSVRGARERLSSTFRSGSERMAAGSSAAADRARAGHEHSEEAMRSGGAAAGGRLSGASEAMRRRARGAYASAAELRSRITHGTEDLSEQARKRVLAARTRAYEAQLRAEHYAARSRERASDFFEEQPLVAGALALAVGAAIGGLLPRTSREDEAFGAYRDQIFEEAERVYREERSKLEAVARETVQEARTVAGEVARDVRSDVEKGVQRTGEMARSKLHEAEDRTREAGERVAETAKEEADKQNLGQG